MNWTNQPGPVVPLLLLTSSFRRMQSKVGKTERTRSETGDVSPGFMHESEYSLFKEVAEVCRNIFNVTIWGSLLDFEA